MSGLGFLVFRVRVRVGVRTAERRPLRNGLASDIELGLALAFNVPPHLYIQTPKGSPLIALKNNMY